jgi:hypothetical protein
VPSFFFFFFFAATLSRKRRGKIRRTSGITKCENALLSTIRKGKEEKERIR